jgi:hypothetical protein
MWILKAHGRCGQGLGIAAMCGVARETVERAENRVGARQRLAGRAWPVGRFGKSEQDEGSVVKVCRGVGEAAPIGVKGFSRKAAGGEGGAGEDGDAGLDEAGGSVAPPAHPPGFGEQVGLARLQPDPGDVAGEFVMLQRQDFGKQPRIRQPVFGP